MNSVSTVTKEVLRWRAQNSASCVVSTIMVISTYYTQMPHRERIGIATLTMGRGAIKLCPDLCRGAGEAANVCSAGDPPVGVAGGEGRGGGGRRGTGRPASRPAAAAPRRRRVHRLGD